jgi:hypothetical protein
MLAPAFAADWPHWRGPNDDGTSPEKGLLREWPKDGPQALWRAPIEIGWSVPSVSNDQVFVIMKGPVGHGETVQCLNAANGSKIWSFSYGNQPFGYRGNWDIGGPRATPAVTEKYVYTIGIKGDMYCLDRSSGKSVWYVDLAKEIFPEDNKLDDTKGYCCSPLPLEGKIMIFRYADDNRGKTPKEGKVPHHHIACLDAETGKVAWRNEDPVRTETAGCEGGTPTIADFGKGKCFLFTANRMLKAVQPSDGKEIWSFEDLPAGQRSNTFPSPTVIGNYVVEIPDMGRLTTVEVDRQNSPFAAKKVWTAEPKTFNCFCQYHSLVPFDGYLFGFDGDVHSNAMQTTVMNLNCIELKTGKLMWKQPGFKGGVSLIEADGLLFVRSLQTLQLVEATPTGYAEKGKIEKLHAFDEKTRQVWLGDWVMPALSNGRLFIRTPSELICYKASK